MTSGRSETLTEQYRINEPNLALRRQFMRFTRRDAALLARLARWAYAIADRLAGELCDHQFAFAPTRAYFEACARQQGIGLDQLRREIAQARAASFCQMFQEAVAGGSFGPEYVERRLRAGKLHTTIDLPLKWYVGSYALYFDLSRKYLAHSFFYNPTLRARAERALLVLFLYDIQVVADAYLYDHLQAAGLNLDAIPVGRAEHDLSDAYPDLRAVIRRSHLDVARVTSVLAGLSKQLQGFTVQAASAVQQVHQSMKQVETRDEHNSGSAQAADASVGELAQAVDRITRGVDELGEALDRLTELVARFRLGDGDDEREPIPLASRRAADRAGQVQSTATPPQHECACSDHTD